jgi:hypothetical protein
MGVKVSTDSCPWTTEFRSRNRLYKTGMDVLKKKNCIVGVFGRRHNPEESPGKFYQLPVILIRQKE